MQFTEEEPECAINKCPDLRARIRAIQIKITMRYYFPFIRLARVGWQDVKEREFTYTGGRRVY